MDERVLAERLIAYDTSRPDRLHAAAEFVKGWLEARDVPVRHIDHDGMPVIVAEAGGTSGPLIVLHGHLDVVPAFEEQFTPRVEGDRLIGRGAYDMKGALAAMMCSVHDVAAQDAVRVRFVCVPDEESEDVEDRLDRPARARRAGQAPTSRSPASRPSFTSACRPRACSRSRSRSTASRHTARRRGSATTRSSRRTTSFAGSRRCRSAASPGPVRPAVDQPRADRRRRCLRQGPRPLPDGRRHPLPPGPGSRRDPGRYGDRRRRDRALLRARAGDRLAHATPTCSRCARRSRARSTATRCRSGATARRTRSRSSRPASRRSSSGRSGRATTDPTNGSRCPRSRATGRRSGTSSDALPARLVQRQPGSGRLHAVGDGEISAGDRRVRREPPLT